MKTLLAIIFLMLGINLDATSQCRVISWEDDFENSEINERYWTYEIGNGCPELCGWGNEELQYYTSESKNVRIEDGKLIIEALRDSIDTMAYSSAKLTTQGLKGMQYGQIEVRAKLPGGKGVWPAIWMLPVDRSTDPWPLCGEIDIMEHVGFESDLVYGTVHTEAYNHLKGTQKGGSLSRNDFENGFHTYKIKWDDSRIEFWIDKVRYFTFAKRSDNKEDWPFDQPFYLILNVAVGGNWGAQQGIDESTWPARMEIESVRVFK